MTAQPATPREVIGYAMCDFRAAGEEDCPEQPGGICEFCYDRADRLMKQLRIAGPDEGVVPREPTEGQWGGLARDIIMWTELFECTPRKLFQHLDAIGRDIPQWLRAESEMRNLDHAVSKGTIAAIIYKAMISAAEKASGDGK